MESRKILDEGPYKELERTPLPRMKRETLACLSALVPDPKLRWRLRVTNHQVPRLYALPKIHKPGEKMRPIVSNISAAHEKMAKWLVSEFVSMLPPEGMYVKNTVEFVDKIKNVHIMPYDMLVSFDVKALFPSIPVDEGMELLKKWLEEQHLNPDVLTQYFKLAKWVMKLNFFQCNGKFYEQTEGTAMGNAFSPFLANLYMANFEMVLKRRNLLPKVWVRYVDDIFCVINRRKVSTLLSLLNSQNPSIKVTCEEEIDGSLPFLDVRVSRRDSRLEFDVYRKPTNTQRCIPITSCHPMEHKIDAFHSMLHRVCNLPLH
jgi:hypothetical protein